MSSIIYRGKRYFFDNKYPTRGQANTHARYLKTSRRIARRPYRGKRVPLKSIKTVVKRIIDGKGGVWFAVYKREG